MGNIHETIDRFSALTPRRKVLIVGTFLMMIALLFAAVFCLGSIKGQQWADSKYLQERDERLKATAVHEEEAKRRDDNERQLAAENAFLRKQSEATAEILKSNDNNLRGDATKFTELLEQRNEKLKQIDADSDYDSQLCGLCSDGEKSGFKFSESVCGRCKTNP